MLKWLPLLILICSQFPIAADGSARPPVGDGKPWEGIPAPVAAIDIRIHNPYEGGPDWPSLARALIELEQGDTLTPERLQQAQDALAPLADVQTEAAVTPDGLRLVFDLTPYRRIKTIAIHGNYPFLEKDVRNAMTVAPGDVFRPGEAARQEDLIARRFREEGYIDPGVHISWERENETGHYHLKVEIDKGPYAVLGELRVRGNAAIDDTALKLRMKLWRRAAFGLGRVRFTRQRLEEDVARLVEYYRAEGYADVKIAADVSVHGPLGRQITVTLNIREGPHYQVEFDGNDFFSDRELRKDLVVFEVGNRGNIGLRRSVNQIRRRYLRAGFAEVRIRPPQAPPADMPDRTREVIIQIDEGPRYIVEQVTVHGRERIGDDTIRDQMLTRPPGAIQDGAYVAEVLQEDLAAVEALYRSRGFLSARVEEEVRIDPQTHKVRVGIRISEGPRTLVDQVVLTGHPPIGEDTLMQDLPLKPGAPFAPFALEEGRDLLASRIAAYGYPHVEVDGDARIRSDRTRADIHYAVTPGPHVEVGQIFFVGTFKTRDRFMRREMGLKRGEDFSLRQVLEGQRKLRNLDIFETVQVHSIGLTQRQETVHLLVRAAEREPYVFVAGGGYQTDKGFFGRTRIGDRNFTGTAKDLSLSAEFSQVGYRVQAGIGDPRVLGANIRADGAVFFERSEPFNQDFGTDTFGARIAFARPWGRYVSTGLGFRYERRENFIREQTAVTTVTDPEAFDPRSIVVTSPSVLYDSRDSFIRPRSGQMIGLGVDISKGLDNQLDDFLKYRLEARAYHTLLERVTLAGRFWAGYLEPYGGDRPPLDQLFFLGGTTTVRGFEENLLRFDDEGNPIGGQLALAGGLEARIDIGRNFEWIPFVDAGSVRQAVGEGGSDDFRWSAGIGLQYITPIGPIGLFYGHKLDRREGESAGQFHLSVGYTF